MQQFHLLSPLYTDVSMYFDNARVCKCTRTRARFDGILGRMPSMFIFVQWFTESMKKTWSTRKQNKANTKRTGIINVERKKYFADHRSKTRSSFLNPFYCCGPLECWLDYRWVQALDFGGWGCLDGDKRTWIRSTVWNKTFTFWERQSWSDSFACCKYWRIFLPWNAFWKNSIIVVWGVIQEKSGQSSCGELLASLQLALLSLSRAAAVCVHTHAL